MAIVPALGAPVAAAVAAEVSAGAIAATAGSFLASTALSLTLSYAAGALQPKAGVSGGETAGRMVAVSNTGTDPRIVILGKFRDAGSLIWHKEHEQHRVMITQIIQVCDLPIQGYVNEIVDGKIEPLVPNDSQTVRGHDDGPGFTENWPCDSDDWVPIVGDGGHGDIWRKTDAPTGIYRMRGRRWERVSGATFHDLPSSDPTSGLGSNRDVAVNRTTGSVFVKRGGFWRLNAFTPGAAGPGDRQLFEASGEPTDGSRFIHWEDEDRRWRWHFKVRYYDGTQTAADPFAIGVSDGMHFSTETPPDPAEWNTSMVGNSRAYKVVTQAYYPNIYTGAFPVQTASIMLGVKVYDPRLAAGGASVDWYGTTVTANQIAWTENAALITAFIKCWPELPGAVPYSEIDEAELIASADISDEPVTNPGGSVEPRYSVNGMVQSTETRDSVEEALEIAMGGHIFRRGGKWVIWAGRARSVTKSFTRNNIVGDDYDFQEGPGLRERKNTVVGTWFIPNQQYVQGSMLRVQNSAFLAEDKGVELTESIHFRFAARSRFTPRRLARIWLRQHRAASRIWTGDLDVEALDLSPLDVVELTEDFIGFAADRFVVAAMDSPFLSPAGETSGTYGKVRCALFAYDPNTWDAPTEDPTEEDPVLPDIRDLSTVDPPASISVAAVNRRAGVDVDGRLTANVRISVGKSPDLYATEYLLQYRMSPENFIGAAFAVWGGGAAYDDEREWASLNKVPRGERDVFYFRLKGLYDGAYYDFRVAALNQFGASSDQYTDDDWTQQIDAYPVLTGRVPLPGPPGSGVTGSNKVVDGDFEFGPTSQVWDLNDETATATGAAEIEATGGKYGPNHLEITITAAAVDDFYRVRNDIYIPVKAGEWYSCLMNARRGGGGPSFRAKLVVLFYDRDKVFVTAVDAITEDVVETAYPERRYVGNLQVPGQVDIVWARVQPRHQALSSGAQQSFWDGIGMKDQERMRSVQETTQLDTSSTVTWSNLVSLTGFQDEASIYFDGESEVLFQAHVRAQVARGASDVASRTRAHARLRLETVGGSTVNIVTRERIAGIVPGELTAAGPGDEESRTLETVLVPAEGHYKVHLEGRLAGDGTNGEAQFLDRWITVRKSG